MPNTFRIDGCKGRFVVKAENALVGDPQIVVFDMTSFNFNRSSSISTIKTMNNCADITLGGSTSYTVSGEMIYATQDPGQALFKENIILQWEFHPDKDQTDAAGAEVPRVYGLMRIESIDMTISADDTHKASFQATGDGDYTLENMW